MRAFAVRLLSFLGIALLGACGALPRPFGPDSNTPPSDLTTPTGIVGGVQVAPIGGTAAPMGRLLAQTVVSNLARYNVPAAVGDGAAARYFLKGHADLNRDHPGLPYVAIIDWTVVDRASGEIGRYRQGIGGGRWEWENGDPRIIAAVGRDAAQPLARLVMRGPVVAVDHGPALDRPATAVAAARGSLPALEAPLPPAIWVDAVTGAPGDGGEALAQAMRGALFHRGMRLAKNRETARYLIGATVALGAAKDGREPVRIVWLVQDPKGAELGRATQVNAVPAGSLNARWGPIAALAADAAVPGIHDVVARVEAASAPPPPPTTRALGLPPSAPLRAVPGRAPPPPT